MQSSGNIQFLDNILNFLKAVVVTTFGQLISLFGIFFIFGIILYFLAKFTRISFVKSVGLKLDIFWTGWLGVPIHELGHALFCIVFFHKIREMKLFNPDPRTGTLGYVSHSYNRRNLYQKIGNFFIGVGPIILGAIVLYAALHYLVPNKVQVFGFINSKGVKAINNIPALDDFSALKIYIVNLYKIGRQTIDKLFIQSNIKNYQFWIFLYISLCVAAHMELSFADLKGAWSGLLTIVIALLFINFVANLFNFNVNQYVNKINNYTGLFVGLFVYAILISLFNFLFTFIVLSFYSVIKYRRMFNPFFF